MPLIYKWLLPGLWLAWCAYWIYSARGLKPVARHEALGSRLLHIVPLALAVLLIAADRSPWDWLDARFVPPSPAGFWLGSAVTAAGLLFAVWARRHIGANWSGTVTVKQGHELITTGPYAVVRHPIYTGLITAFLGCALALGQWRGLLATAIVTLALWRKLRHEERWMQQEFGEAYRSYRARVRALLPFPA